MMSGSSIQLTTPHLGIAIKTEKDLMGPEGTPELLLQQSVNQPRGK